MTKMKKEPTLVNTIIKLSQVNCNTGREKQQEKYKLVIYRRNLMKLPADFSVGILQAGRKYHLRFRVLRKKQTNLAAKNATLSKTVLQK